MDDQATFIIHRSSGHRQSKISRTSRLQIKCLVFSSHCLIVLVLNIFSDQSKNNIFSHFSCLSSKGVKSFPMIANIVEWKKIEFFKFWFLLLSTIGLDVTTNYMTGCLMSHIFIIIHSSVYMSFDVSHSPQTSNVVIETHDTMLLPLKQDWPFLNMKTASYLCFSCCTAVKIKKPIQTKFRLPVLNWVALKPSQINGTIFNDIDDESILQVKHICFNFLSIHQ